MDNEKLFDDAAKNYDDLLQKNLAMYGKNIAYYSEYKIKLISNIVKNKNPERILEFGCGIGKNIQYLKHYFPHSKIVGCDISNESLRQAKKDNNELIFVTIDEALAANELYDFIFVANVFHHIIPKDRDKALSQLYTLLAQSGELVIFEHNPYNPLTVKAVNTCPFDEGVILLKPKETIQRALKANFHLQKKQYCLFFPSALKILSPLEIFLSYFPIGGQYFVSLTKT